MKRATVVLMLAALAIASHAKTFDPWLLSTLAFQRKLTLNVTLDRMTDACTHNAYNTIDVQPPEMLNWQNSLLLDGKIVLENQVYSIPDQLTLGTRRLQLDIHWVQELDKVLCCHASTASADLCPLLESASPGESCEDLTGYSNYGEHTGCTEHNHDWLYTLTQVSNWTQIPGNENEFIVIEIENAASGAPDAYVMDPIKNVLGSKLLKRSELEAWRTDSGKQWPTVYQAVYELKKNFLVFFSDPYTFAEADEYTLDIQQSIGYPDNMVKNFDSVVNCGGLQPSTFGVYYEDNSRIVFDYLGFKSDVDGNVDVGVMTEARTRGINACGIQACFDQYQESDVQGLIWTWKNKREGERSCEPDKCAASTSDGWELKDCASKARFACVSDSNDQQWSLPSSTAAWSSSANCPTDYSYSYPRNAPSAAALRKAISTASVDFVWLNHAVVYDAETPYCDQEEDEQPSASSRLHSSLLLASLILAVIVTPFLA